MARTRGAQNRYGAATEGHIQARRQRSEMRVKWAERTTMSAGSRYILARQPHTGACLGPSGARERLIAGRALPVSRWLFCHERTACPPRQGLFTPFRRPKAWNDAHANRPIRWSWKVQDPALESSRRALQLEAGSSGDREFSDDLQARHAWPLKSCRMPTPVGIAQLRDN